MRKNTCTWTGKTEEEERDIAEAIRIMKFSEDTWYCCKACAKVYRTEKAIRKHIVLKHTL